MKLKELSIENKTLINETINKLNKKEIRTSSRYYVFPIINEKQTTIKYFNPYPWNLITLENEQGKWKLKTIE